MKTNNTKVSATTSFAITPLPETLPRGRRISSNSRPTGRPGSSTVDDSAHDMNQSYILTLDGRLDHERKAKNDVYSEISTNSSVTTAVTGGVVAFSIASDVSRQRNLFPNERYDASVDVRDQRKHDEEEENNDLSKNLTTWSTYDGVSLRSCLDIESHDDYDSSASDSSTSDSSYDIGSFWSSTTAASTIIEHELIIQSQDQQMPNMTTLERLSSSSNFSLSPTETTEQKTTPKMKTTTTITKVSRQVPEALPRIRTNRIVPENVSQKKDSASNRRKTPLIRLLHPSSRMKCISVNKMGRKKEQASAITTTNSDTQSEEISKRDQQEEMTVLQNKIRRIKEIINFSYFDENSIVESHCGSISDKRQEDEDDDDEDGNSTKYSGSLLETSCLRLHDEQAKDKDKDINDESAASSWFQSVLCWIGETAEEDRQDEYKSSVHNYKYGGGTVETRSLHINASERRESVKHTVHLAEVVCNQDADDRMSKSTTPNETTFYRPVQQKKYSTEEIKQWRKSLAHQLNNQQEIQRHRQEKGQGQNPELNSSSINDTDRIEKLSSSKKKKDAKQKFRRMRSFFKPSHVLAPQKVMAKSNYTNEEDDEDKKPTDSSSEGDKREKLIQLHPTTSKKSDASPTTKKDLDVEGGSCQSESRQPESAIRCNRPPKNPFRRSSRKKDLRRMVISYTADRLTDQMTKRKQSAGIGFGHIVFLRNPSAKR